MSDAAAPNDSPAASRVFGADGTAAPTFAFACGDEPMPEGDVVVSLQRLRTETALGESGRSHSGALALVELQNGAAPASYVAGTQNFYTVTRYNWSSYYAMAVIELGQAIERQRSTGATGSGPAR